MNKKLLSLIVIILVAIMALAATGCNDSTVGLSDGYYTAEDKTGSHGWYEFLTIYVNDGKIVSAEYNAKNSSGFIKSWDMNYMRNMDPVDGTYPNEYTREYAKQLLDAQSTEGIDTIAGATHSYSTFMALAEVVLEKARNGDKTVAMVDINHEQ